MNIFETLLGTLTLVTVCLRDPEAGLFTTEAGTITLHSVGRYRGLPTALVTTWDTHYLAVINSRTLAIASSPPNGNGLMVVYFHPTARCV